MIIVDNREFKSKTVRELFKLGAELTPKQLSVGDYIIGDLCVERKSLEDFYDSIVDKRIFEQLKSIKNNYEKKLLIIEGENCSRNIHPNAVKGLIASIVVDYRIPIIFSKNAIETAEFLSVVEKRMDKKIEPVVKDKKSKNDYESAINLLTSIPGIGAMNAEKLLMSAKSLKKVFLLSNEDLKKILGEKLSIKFINFINEEL